MNTLLIIGATVTTVVGILYFTKVYSSSKTKKAKKGGNRRKNQKGEDVK